MNTDNRPTHTWRCSKCKEMIAEEPCKYCAGAPKPIIESPTIQTKKQKNNESRGYVIFIKCLIWIACFIVYLIINTLLVALTGFGFGYGISGLILLFIAIKLCRKWEENYTRKKRKKQQEEC